MEQTINANLNTCLQQAKSIGGTTYHNVCSGKSHWVPWGSLDWLGVLALTVFIVLVFAIVVLGVAAASAAEK